ncbi:GH25 family lysozyme [Sphingomonas gilva]|uniref:GH25 family lysozyme n=1 Tax=Sphingomonas gilva TaxID=2305907 RepID=UPI001FE32338|nr:GH25 family lysozyme [Sphingomonas gilva]
MAENPVKRRKPRTPARILKRLALLLALAGVAVLAAWLYARQWRPDLAKYPVQGVDVSTAQGAIDWPHARADGVDFAYLTATSGGARDPAFAANWAATGAIGLRRGAMHRWSLCAPAAAQATGFLATVPREADALPPALVLAFDADCARRPGRDAVIAALTQFLAAAETHLGKPMVLKVTEDFEAAYAVTPEIDRTLWVVANGLAPEYGARPWVMWQASDMHRVDGIDAPVNWNVMRP